MAQTQENKIVEVYLYGCNCGVNGAYIRKIRRYAQRLNLAFRLNETKYDKALRDRHRDYLMQLGLPVDSWTPLVVYNNQIMDLRKWNS